MATIQTRKDKAGRLRFRAQVRVTGARPISETFGTRKAARDWADKTESAIRSGLWHPPAPGTLHTLQDAVTRYRADVLPSKRPNTQASYAVHLDWWIGKVGHLALSDITPALVCECRDKLKDGREPASVNRYLATLSAVLGVASREWQWMPANPCLSVSRLREPRGRVRYLSRDERSRLLAECKASKSAALYPVVVMALSTGARRGELLGLRWRDANLGDGVLTFHGTKNGEDRSVPVRGAALEVLRDWGRVRPMDGHALVFPSTDGTGPASLREAFEHALRRAQINDFRWHDMRHDAASRMAMSGCSSREIQEMLGHKCASMTARYSHLNAEHLCGVAERAAL